MFRLFGLNALGLSSTATIQHHMFVEQTFQFWNDPKSLRFNPQAKSCRIKKHG